MVSKGFSSVWVKSPTVLVIKSLFSTKAVKEQAAPCPAAQIALKIGGDFLLTPDAASAFGTERKCKLALSQWLGPVCSALDYCPKAVLGRGTY